LARPRRLPIEQLRRFLLDVPHPRTPPEVFQRQVAAMPAGPLAWRDLFGNEHPVEIEVGFGKGLFLLNAAGRRPDTNFLGIEIERKYVLLTAARLARLSLANVRLACTDALWLLRERVAPGSVAAIHVYFPDPWWKQRHHKRRLFTTEFADACARAIVLGGRLYFASDVAEYFGQTNSLLQQVGLWQAREWPQRAEALDEEDYLTNFERKYRKEGRAVYRALYERMAADR
jgi:tRNA (guanine-N7-)-methyltransferase